MMPRFILINADGGSYVRSVRMVADHEGTIIAIETTKDPTCALAYPTPQKASAMASLIISFQAGNIVDVVSL